MTHESPLDAPMLLGQSAAIQVVRKAIGVAARTDAAVLIMGETGVGKDVVARCIHAQSRRASRAFVAINASGIPDTLLESELFGHTQGSFTGAYREKVGLVASADRGTFFLDEVGEMSLRMQTALLRFTETGEIQRIGGEAQDARVDVRLITATSPGLHAALASGTFREDLYYRLNVLQIDVPPLRNRSSDIPLLLEHYLKRAAEVDGLGAPTFTREAVGQLLRYDWPGNVRELRNLAERVVARQRSGPLTPHDLPREIFSASIANARR